MKSSIPLRRLGSVDDAAGVCVSLQGGEGRKVKRIPLAGIPAVFCTVCAHEIATSDAR